MASVFVDELERLLARRRLSWRRLAELTGYHPSWLSKIRHGAPPSADLVRRCDEALEADGALMALAAVGKKRRPAQLPAPPAGFVGRKSQMRRMADVLNGRIPPTGEAPPGAPAIVAIEGPPGAGKTAAALRCAHDIGGSGEESYADGRLYADLRGYSPDGRPVQPGEVLAEFLIALGIQPQDIPEGLEQRAKVYRSLLATRQLLVVLDNAASSGQVEPLLPGSAGCGVIVTSRRRLVGLPMRVAVERISLGPMTEKESMAVLRAAVGDARARAETASLTLLARRCGHLPLALRIAAERVAAHPHHPLDELVDELAAERHRLDALEVDDSVAVRTVFGWSYRELGDDEARMFRLLGLHRGPHISVESAAALAGTSVVQARRILQKLALVHLLEGAPHSRYRFHDLLQVYAAERVEAESAAAERNSAIRRLADWYLHSIAAGSRALAPFRPSPMELGSPAPGITPLTFSSDQHALRWYDLEAPNLASIIRLAVDHRLYETAWKMGIALFDYLRLLRKPGALWLATATLAHKATRAAGDRRAQGWAETSLAEGYRWLRQYDRSRQLFEHSLSLQRDVGDRHGQAWALAGLGFVAVDREQMEIAYDHAREALSLFREVGDRHGQASAMFTLADVHHGRRRHDETLDVLEAALKIFEEIENHDGQGLTLAKMAETYTALGKPEQALDHIDRSLRARRLAGSRWGEADGLARRGRILHALGRPEHARESWEAALALYEKVDDPRAADIRAYLQGQTADPGAGILTRPAW
ncbi:tetratricopeptide repeat protein [Actinomadura sp. KC216]|uniref:tetratricopeptide repeat protein n=1 Tax=Actinomadura sp. KC216 TaxID=2530370 RepID=UPI00104E6CD8|nr:tetratricopeptide repeat protein [Actinomadura sp. KC216]TDB81290.1 tetratricopeptide repeat protein [Actinomadura sp. KC216]